MSENWSMNWWQTEYFEVILVRSVNSIHVSQIAGSDKEDVRSCIYLGYELHDSESCEFSSMFCTHL